MSQMPPRIVTLTTDFGTGSSYVAEMKGRLLHARSPFTIVDIAHDVPAHDVRAAAWLIAHACHTFPADSLHVIVVDPGVGTARRIVWVRAGGQQFLAPDNGVLTRILATFPVEACHAVSVPPDASATFHGRDVFAPAAAALVDGIAPEALGPVVTTLETFPTPSPYESSRGVEGEVVHVDHFGNLLTNLPASLLPRLVQAGRLIVGDTEVLAVVRTYGEAPPGKFVALVGSQGVIEAAVVGGRANEAMEAGVGTKVILP
jgi:S-adenosylmethionine hydrolase